MTLVQKTFDSQPSGTTATTSNTGASSVNALNGGAVTFDSSMAARGTQCGLKIVATASGSAADIRYTVTSNSKYAITFVLTVPAATPSSDVRVFQADADVAKAFALTFSTKNQLYILDNVNVSSTVAATLTPGTRYRVGIVVDNTGGTAAGKITVNVYTESGTTALGTATSSASNLSTGGFTMLRFGATGWPTEGGTIGIDDVQWNDGATTEIPSYVAAGAAPTVVSNDRVLYVIDRSGSSSNDSGTLTYSIAQTSGTTTPATLLAPGVWGVVQSTTVALGYTVTITDSVYGPKTSTATVPQQTAGTNVSAPLHWSTTSSSWV